MQRFGRSAQQKMKDRWGGGFILATILALVGAFYVGSWLNKTYNPDSAATDPGKNNGFVQNNPLTGNGNQSIAGNPQSFDVHLVQVGAFRSQDSARKLVNSLSAKNYTAMMSARGGKDGLYKVYAGLFTDAQMAKETKNRVASEPGVTNPWVVSVSVTANTEAIPVAAMQNVKSADLKKGMENMVSYLYEAARWMENGAADTATLSVRGKEFSKLATEMSKMKDTTLAPYTQLAQNASANATAIEAAAKAAVGSTEYNNAMTGYLSLLDEYRGLGSAAPAGN